MSQQGRSIRVALIAIFAALLSGQIGSSTVQAAGTVLLSPPEVTTATTVVNTDFDNATVGSLPAPYVHQVSGDCPTEAISEVSSDASVSAPNSIKTANFCASSGSGFFASTRSMDLVDDQGMVTGARWTLSRRMETASFAFMNLVTNQPGEAGVGLFWYQDGTLRVRPDGLSSPTQVVGTYTVGQFHEIDTVWDFSAGHFDLYIDGSFVGNYPYPLGRPGRAISGSNQVVTFYDDDETLNVFALDPVVVGATVTGSAAFSATTDADDHVAVWSWGDGTTTSGVVDQSANTVSGSHSYSQPGVYTVSLSITDGDGSSDSATFEYVVVYDPAGGFVTGGGWIDSPAGAYSADSSLTGRANFGFVSKYGNGASTPSGNTNFQFKAGDLHFRSDSYDWLVIAGQDKAKFKGTGTINHAGNFGFMLTAVDGNPDTLRIKIWDKDDGDGVVYDNQMGNADDDYDGTTIGGGNIKVQKQ